MKRLYVQSDMLETALGGICATLGDTLRRLCCFVLFASCMVMSLHVYAQQPRPAAAPKVMEKHYRVFTAEGRPASLADVVERATEADVVFVGETHDDPGAHHIEAELLRRLHERYAQTRAVALSLEIFERDVQIVLDEYLANLITEQHFLRASRPWDNYASAYRPLVELAREQKLKVIAANAPRRYVNLVSRNGREPLARLAPAAQAWLAPHGFAAASPAYARKFTALMRPEGTPAHTPAHTPSAVAHGSAAPRMPSLENLLEAQSLWDATMAHSISEHLRRADKLLPLVLHVHGKFHSEERLGVPEHLARYHSRVRSLVVTVISGEGFPDFDSRRHLRAGDYVVLTDPALRSKN